MRAPRAVNTASVDVMVADMLKPSSSGNDPTELVEDDLLSCLLLQGICLMICESPGVCYIWRILAYDGRHIDEITICETYEVIEAPIGRIVTVTIPRSPTSFNGNDALRARRSATLDEACRACQTTLGGEPSIWFPECLVLLTSDVSSMISAGS